MESLNKTYGDLRALRDLSMEVRAGEIVGFVGSNGAGKSTAMRIVLGVLAADSGEVRWDGKPVDLAVRRRIGYMPEERGLYPRMKVSDQLVYLARLHGLSTASAKAAMEQWTEVLGIAERRGDEILKLSLGNQQRVQLAAALVHSPDILVLDEPFSGLDPVAVDVMSGVLRDQAAAGVPVLFSSHQLELVESPVRPRRDHQDRVAGGLRRDRGAAPDRRPAMGGGRATGGVVDLRGAVGPPGVDGRDAVGGRGAGTGRRRRRPADPAGGARGRVGARVQPAAAVPDRAVPARGEHRLRRGRARDGVRMSARPTLVEISDGAAVRLVAGREISTRFRSKAFIWTTVALVAAVVLGGVLLNLVGSQSDPTQHVGVTPEASAVSEQLVATGTVTGTTIETQEVASADAGEELLKDGTIDALVTSTDPLTVVVHTKLPDVLAPVFASLAQQEALSSAVTDLGGDPGEVGREIAQAAPDVTALEPEPEQDGAQIVAGFVAGILLFISLMTAGQLVAQGVVEEKSCRVVELLLATVRPWQLMAGKVLGIGVIGLIQVVLVVGAGSGTALALGLVDASSIDLGVTALWVVIWFVIGFTMYALALGALAALVSRQEDVGSVTAPVMTLMMIPYIIGVSIAPWDPTNPLVVWLSYVPFCSPLLMPMRIALGEVDAWEVALALGLSLAVIPVLVWLAGRIYSSAVLRSGGRIKLKDALTGS